MRRIQAFLKCVSDAYANGKGGVAIHGGGRWVTMSAASRAPPLLPSGRNASAAISEMGSNPPQTRSLGSIFHFKLQNYMSGGGMLLVFAAGVAIGCRLDSKADNGGPPGASHWAEAQQLLSGLFKPLQSHAHSQPLQPISVPPPPPIPPQTMPLSGCLGPFFIADAAAKAAPAVVNVLVQQESGVPVGSSGSGFILDADGTILTSLHVVADAVPGGALLAARKKVLQPPKDGGKRTITVTLLDGRIFDATLVSYDAVSDLAVLKVEPDSPLPTVRLGSSAGLRAGEWVVALGSPLHLQNSVTAGIVSCVDRKGVELGLAGARTEFIQTDASINRGSSGGPLVNLAGEVVGVSCMKAVAADGVSFAIPMDTAREVVRQLAAHGRVIRPFIGVKLLQLNRHSAHQLRKRDPEFPEVDGGVLVPHVYGGSPAEKAGLRPGDVIVGFGGQRREVTTASLIKALGENIGRPLELRVLRRGAEGGGKAPVEATLSVVSQEADSG